MTDRAENRFPELLARINAAKATPLSERVEAVLSAVNSMPEGFGNYQWEAHERQLFGDKWVGSVAGNDGRGMGRQAIAAVPSHLSGVANYIAATNPDTVLTLIAENEETRAALAEQTARIAALEAERERLREALLPFKHEADRITPLGTNAEASIGGGVQIWQSGPMSVARTAITYGDLRIARAALQERPHAG